MADEIPIIPKAGQLWVHTGNIVNWNRLKKKLTQLPAEELSECISSTLTSWLEHADKSALQYATSVECADEKFAEKILEDEREPLKVTVKVFLSIPSADEVEEAVEKELVVVIVCCDLHLSHDEHRCDSTAEVASTLGHKFIESGLKIWPRVKGL